MGLGLRGARRASAPSLAELEIEAEIASRPREIEAELEIASRPRARLPSRPQSASKPAHSSLVACVSGLGLGFGFGFGFGLAFGFGLRLRVSG